MNSSRQTSLVDELLLVKISEARSIESDTEVSAEAAFVRAKESFGPGIGSIIRTRPVRFNLDQCFTQLAVEERETSPISPFVENLFDALHPFLSTRRTRLCGVSHHFVELRLVEVFEGTLNKLHETLLGEVATLADALHIGTAETFALGEIKKEHLQTSSLTALSSRMFSERAMKAFAPLGRYSF